MAGNSRKNELKALFGGAMPVNPMAAPETKSASELDGIAAALAQGGTPAHEATSPREMTRAASGAVKAMGLTLGAITREAEEARALRQALEEGERIIALDPALVDASFVEDRLTVDGRDDDDFLALVESMRESGQHAPVLVRPHPQQDGRYQTAYGHRRLKAARRLGIAVKAIVRPLSDAELVLAQGKENAERRNLTFIERALFAQVLVARGFERKVAGDALAVMKSELSRLLQVADAVPEGIIRAIGPAPKIGRERWMALGALLSSEAAQVMAAEEMGFKRFRAAGSDERFQLIFNRLSKSGKSVPAEPQELKDAGGTVFARLKRDGKAARIEFVTGTDPGFVDSAAELLAKHYAAFQAGRGS